MTELLPAVIKFILKQKKRPPGLSVILLTENTRRDKSLAGFSIWFAYLAKGEIYKLDMCFRTRYAFAFLAKGEIWQKREGFISYRIGAERQYIELERSESISNSSFVNVFHESEYIDRKKQEQE